MKSSAKAEYACLAILELARRQADQRPVSIKEIAREHGLPPRYLVHLLLQLKGAGLVESTRGVTGGYRLVRGPQEISLADVYEIFEERPQRRRPAKAAGLPPARLLLQQALHEVAEAEMRAMREITFAELLTRLTSAGTMYHI